MAATNVLDHIVHLTPPGTVEQASDAFRKLGFEVVPGGTHAGGVTYNALVSLADGVYLELIAFVNSPQDPNHRWGSSRPGWIDYAHLGLEHDVAKTINSRAEKDGSGARYQPGVDGGRETPAGKILKWRVTPPVTEHGVGRLPFFCQDVTPRDWRVPTPGSHPSTAKGVSYIKVAARTTVEFEELSRQLSSVIGSTPSKELTTSDSQIISWTLTTPSPIKGLHPKLILALQENSATSGIAEVGFFVDKDKGGSPDSPFGKIIFTPTS